MTTANPRVPAEISLTDGDTLDRAWLEQMGDVPYDPDKHEPHEYCARLSPGEEDAMN